MSNNPLFNGTEKETLFKAGLQIPPLPTGESLRNNDELRAWIEKAVISIESQQTAMFSYTAGPVSSATAEDRDKPRFLFNETGTYLGIALYMPANQNWSLAGVPGELKTVIRTASTVEKDMEDKFLFGWALADGSNGAIPSQITNDAFFQGSAPDWDVYTVGKFA